jgi:hypothetical protein
MKTDTCFLIPVQRRNNRPRRRMVAILACVLISLALSRPGGGADSGYRRTGAAIQLHAAIQPDHGLPMAVGKTAGRLVRVAGDQ